MSAIVRKPLTNEQKHAVEQEVKRSRTSARLMYDVLKEAGVAVAYNDSEKGAKFKTGGYTLSTVSPSVQWAVWDAIFDYNRD